MLELGSVVTPIVHVTELYCRILYESVAVDAISDLCWEVGERYGLDFHRLEDLCS